MIGVATSMTPVSKYTAPPTGNWNERPLRGIIFCRMKAWAVPKTSSGFRFSPPT